MDTIRLSPRKARVEILIGKSNEKLFHDRKDPGSFWRISGANVGFLLELILHRYMEFQPAL